MKRLVFAALAAGFFLRAGYARHAHTQAYIPTTSDGYETIAVNLISGGGYSYEFGKPTSHREPGYPLFIAAVYELFGRQPGIVLFLQCLLSVLTAYLAFLIGKRLFGERVGLFAAVAYSLYPQAVYYSGYFFRETISALLVTILIYASTRWKEDERWALGGGLCAAGAALTNTGLLPAAVLAGVVLRGRRLAFYFAPVVLACGAWTVRNTLLQGRLVLGSTHGGEELYQALIVPPSDLGTARQTEIIAADPVYTSISRADEGERNAVLTRASVEWILANPGLYASRAAAGLVKFWRLWPYRRSYDHGYAALVAASLLSDGWLVPLGLFGFWLFRRRFKDAPAAWLCVAATWVFYGLVHAVIRYRMPLMPAVCVFAAAVLERLFGTIRAPR